MEGARKNGGWEGRNKGRDWEGGRELGREGGKGGSDDAMQGESERQLNFRFCVAIENAVISKEEFSQCGYLHPCVCFI